MRKFYELCVANGTSGTVFFDGSIDSAEKFLSTVKSPGNLVVFFFIDGVPASFGWLNDIRRHSAFAHFCVLKSAWGLPAIEMGKKALRYWMGFGVFHLILGTIPTINRRALRYVKAIGFKTCGTIPKLIDGRDGNLHAAELVYFERT